MCVDCFARALRPRPACPAIERICKKKCNDTPAQDAAATSANKCAAGCVYKFARRPKRRSIASQRERGTVEQHWNTHCWHSGTTVQRQWDSGTTTVERTALGHGLSPAPASTATTIAFGQLSSALPLPPPPSSHACPPSSLARHAPRSFSVRLQVLHNADAADVAAVAALAAPSTLLEQTDFNCNCLRRGALHCASLCVCCVFVACVCECASQCFSSCRGFYVLLLLLLLSLIQRVACSSGKRQQLLRQ